VYDDDGNLLSAGSVGTGWNSSLAAALLKRLQKLEMEKSPLDSEHAPTKGRWSKRVAGSERWVKPITVAEVSFAEWTPDGSIRHATFQGLRADQRAKSMRREAAVATVSSTR
jgi:bifunctional non-homologous end joining protein LigD